ncbi:MAG TPA: hypothetical protein VGR03_02900 [Candidatus Acidoferrum sp.]|nr:hypothetical protein [Candidatus Acidoferrum sp.]
MKKYRSLHWTVMLAFAVPVGGLVFGGLALAQRTLEKTLIVNGKPVAGAMADMQGRTYVDLQMLSQTLGGTLTFETDRITLVIPAAGAGNSQQTRPQAPTSQPPTPEHLSTNFRTAAITALGEMRQWQGAVESVITYGIPVAGSWPQDYRDRAESGINQAKVVASTDEDRSALLLLENDFASLRNWSDTVVTERKSLHGARFVDPDALKKDTALAKITDCSRFLGGMISGGVYSDNASCH